MLMSSSIIVRPQLRPMIGFWPRHDDVLSTPLPWVTLETGEGDGKRVCGRFETLRFAPDAPMQPIIDEWRRQQHVLEQQIVQEDSCACDDGGWGWPGLKLVGGVDISFFPPTSVTPADGVGVGVGVGVGAASISAEDLKPQEQGVAALVVLTYPDLHVVYEDYEPLPLSVPYIPGYLGFREVPAYLTLLERVKNAEGGKWTPQVLLVDGCGVLHPAGCGSASHLGVVSGYPTVGVAKNLLAVDGLDRVKVEGYLLTQRGVMGSDGCVRGAVDGDEQEVTTGGHTSHMMAGSSRDIVQENVSISRHKHNPNPISRHKHNPNPISRHKHGPAIIDTEHTAMQAQLQSCVPGKAVIMPLIGISGRVWGAALTTMTSKKPLYVSVGHRVSLATAVWLVSRCCRTRIPEPIRQADLRSREVIRKAGHGVMEGH